MHTPFRRPTLARLAWRCLWLRCPVCGRGTVFPKGLRPAERCGTCGFFFHRGREYGAEGYFSGAMAINLVLTGLPALIALFILAVVSDMPTVPLLAAGIAWATLFPIVFYRHAAALWVFIDHAANPPRPAELPPPATTGNSAPPVD